MLASPPIDDPPAYQLPRRRLMAALLATATGLTGATLSPRVAASAPPLVLYRTDQARTPLLVPIDPLTLADQPGASAFDPGSPYWDLSADGSRLVTLEYEDQRQAAGRVEIVVRDPADGAQRRRFRPPIVVCCPRLSRPTVGPSMSPARSTTTAQGPRRPGSAGWTPPRWPCWPSASCPITAGRCCSPPAERQRQCAGCHGLAAGG